MDNALKCRKEDGLSLTEVMIAIFIIIVALMAIAMTMVQGIAAVYHTQQQLIAKQKAREALESIFTARNTQGVTFNQIRNTTASGILLTGFQPIRGTGIDGIANTADDAATEIESLTFPGEDGLLGTLDDEVIPLTEYERRVTVSSVLDTEGHVDPDIRKVEVQVRFKTNNVWRSVTVASLISRFA